MLSGEFHGFPCPAGSQPDVYEFTVYRGSSRDMRLAKTDVCSIVEQPGKESCFFQDPFPLFCQYFSRIVPEFSCIIPMKNGLVRFISSMQISMTFPVLDSSSVIPHRRSSTEKFTPRFSHSCRILGNILLVRSFRSSCMSENVEERKMRTSRLSAVLPGLIMCIRFVGT